MTSVQHQEQLFKIPNRQLDNSTSNKRQFLYRYHTESCPKNCTTAKTNVRDYFRLAVLALILICMWFRPGLLLLVLNVRFNVRITLIVVILTILYLVLSFLIDKLQFWELVLDPSPCPVTFKPSNVLLILIIPLKSYNLLDMIGYNWNPLLYLFLWYNISCYVSNTFHSLVIYRRIKRDSSTF